MTARGAGEAGGVWASPGPAAVTTRSAASASGCAIRGALMGGPRRGARRLRSTWRHSFQGEPAGSPWNEWRHVERSRLAPRLGPPMRAPRIAHPLALAALLVVTAAGPGLAQTPPASPAPRAVITLEKGGQITLELFPADAPKHVANFTKLV